MSSDQIDYTLYGLEGYEAVIENIINTFNAREIEFEIKVILTEGLSNAFKHGNKSNKELPIKLLCRHEHNELIFEIEDSGSGGDYIILPDIPMSEDLLEESGRGLFLIRCYSDSVHMEINKLIIRKLFIKEG